MAAELNIDPAKIGVSGTSAGGYLADSVGTLSEVKPDFMILYYPVISADADKRPRGRSCSCSAPTCRQTRRAGVLARKKVDARTPPTLLFTATMTRWCLP
ncbi:MAG: alpha/beta hydrolase [Alistipes finegoldii]